MKCSSFWALKIYLFCFSIVLSNINGVFGSHNVFLDLQSLSAVSVKKVHRTGFHFQPPKHWINGMFILFFFLSFREVRII